VCELLQDSYFFNDPLDFLFIDEGLEDFLNRKLLAGDKVYGFYNNSE